MVLIKNRSPPRYSGTMFTVLAMQVTFCCNPEQVRNFSRQIS